MAIAQELLEHGQMGNINYATYKWTITGGTSGTVSTMLGKIKFTHFTNKTEARGAIDDSTTAGAVAISGVTDGDTGYVTVYGYS